MKGITEKNNRLVDSYFQDNQSATIDCEVSEVTDLKIGMNTGTFPLSSQPLESKSAPLSSSSLKSEEPRDSVKYLESQDSSNKIEIWNLNYCL